MIEAVADQVFIPLTVGGGVRFDGRHARAAERRRRQGQHQHRRGQESGTFQAGVGPLRGAMHRGGDRCARNPRSTSGRYSPTADARRPASMRYSGRATSWRRGAGEILLTSMDRDGAKSGFDLELTRAVADAVDVPVIASRRRGHAQRPGRGHHDRRRGRGARGIDLPLRRVHDRPGQGRDERRRHRSPRLARAGRCREAGHVR